MTEPTDTDPFWVPPPPAPPEAEPRPTQPFLAPPDPAAAWENDAFFGARRTGAPALAPPKPGVLDAPLKPLRFAGVLSGVGALAILFAATDVLQHLVIVAPIFEEMLKFGVALALVTVLGARTAPFRVLLALAPGAGFGVLEHFVTYAEEDASGFALRVAFHACAAALSMATWSAVERLPTHRHQWLSTVPSTLLHATNNAFALLVGIAVLVSGERESVLPVARTIQATLVGLLAVAALATLAAPDAVRRVATRVARGAWFSSGPTS